LSDTPLDFTGAKDETGSGAGTGFNINIPLPKGTGDEGYIDALSKATDRIKKFRPAFVIVRFVLAPSLFARPS
jgi:acetoin utilization deacetylase AcuC-like enzyme